MTRRKASFLQGTDAARYQLPAEDHRLNHSALWTPSSQPGAAPLAVQSGIVWGPGNPGNVALVAGGVTVTPFHAAVQGARSGVQGVFEVTSDAAEFRAITADSSTTFRRGRFGLRIYDQLNGAARDDWDLEVLYGPGASTAGAATLPPLPTDSTWFELRQFAVSNTGAITLSGITQRTMPRGGILPVAAGDVTPGAYSGQYRDAAGLERWTGSVWDHPLVDSGWVNCTVYQGFTGNGTPQVRRVGPFVYARNGWTNAGMAANGSYNVGEIPAGLRPLTSVYGRAGVSSGANGGGMVIGADGIVMVRPGAAVSPYYRMDPVTWLLG